jgi:hypothetical protein
MSFRDQEFSARFTAMGDAAEQAHDDVFPAHHKSGLNRPPMKVGQLSPMLRCLPDRMKADGWTECMGVGRDQIIKVKIDKLIQLVKWSVVAPVHIFINDSHKKRWCIGPVDDWTAALFEHGEYGEFPNDNNPYVGLPCYDVPFPWVKK